MALTLQRLTQPLRPSSPYFSTISPSVRTGFALTRKQSNGPPLKPPRRPRRQEDHQTRHIVNKAARPPTLLQTPMPLGAQTPQETHPVEPYFVRRTGNRNLPIYEVTKAGGNLRQTLVKHIEGDINALKEDIQVKMKPSPQWIRINPVTGHLEMKGGYKSQIEQLLKSLGF